MNPSIYLSLITIGDKLTKEIQLAATQMRQEKSHETKGELYRIIDHVEEFTTLSTESVFMSDGATQDELKPVLKNLSIELLAILRAIVSSWEKNDIFMLCDLMEYELVDNLIRWKIQIISTLKNQDPNKAKVIPV